MVEERPEERWTVSCCDKHPWARVRFRDRALACFACEREEIPGVPHFHNVEVVPVAKLKEQERCERYEEALSYITVQASALNGPSEALKNIGIKARTALQHSSGDEG